MTTEDPYASMEKELLISMIHYLENRDETSKKENEQSKELLRSLREEYREDSEQTQRLLKTIEVLTQQIRLLIKVIMLGRTEDRSEYRIKLV